MSDRSFYYGTEGNGELEDRSSTMVEFVRPAVELAGTEAVSADRLALTGISLKMLGHPNPNVGVDMERKPGGVWRAVINGEPADFEAAWLHYLDLLADHWEHKPSELRLRAVRELARLGESIVLGVDFRHRSVNKTERKRHEDISASLSLVRTFGVAGGPGVGIMQRQYSGYWLLAGHSVIDCGIGSSYAYYQASRNRRLGSKVKDAPEEWAGDLEQQFSTEIPIKALTPDEWRYVLSKPLVDNDVMTEDR